MGLERRGNNYYYYEKKRIGDRVRTVYVASGQTALIFDALNSKTKKTEKLVRQLEHRKFLRLRQREFEIESAIDSYCELSRAFTDAFLLVSGYHQHKREWRKKRNGKTKD